MKRLTLIAFVLMIGLVYCNITIAGKVILQWDAVENVDGYNIYVTVPLTTENGEIITEFDYSTPITTEAFPGGNVPQDVTEIEVEVLGELNKKLDYHFVARAFRGDNQSEDSNEVVYTVDRLIPATPIGVHSEYDNVSGLITLRWEQPIEEFEIAYWSVFYRIKDDTSIADWVKIGQVNSGLDLTLTAPFDVVALDEIKTVEFTIVAYRNDDTFSHNSDIVSLLIDRTEVPPIETLRIKAEIPVL